MGLDLALVRFGGQTAASAAFGTMRDRVGGDAPWTHEVALVEHHHNGRIALRGTFAGHYVDVDEEDHLSQPGAATGALTGGLIRPAGYSAICSPEPPDSAGKSLNFGSPSFMGRTVSA